MNYDIKYLKLLSKQYPTIQSACTEIINLEAIRNLPKGTEHFMSDIHGEYQAFLHILNNASGIIKEKIDSQYGNTLTVGERKSLAALIYYPEQMIEEVQEDGEDMDDWYRITLNRLIDVCRNVASKYTRSKVRKALPKDFEYIIDELLHTNYDDMNKELYYSNIIDTIIRINRAEEFIVAMCNLIKRMAVDRLHIVGDIFDRGPHADVILDKLMAHHSVDVQWGNHDVLWMGAACGSDACIATALGNSLAYNNLDIVENDYGINLLPLAMFATETYKNAGLFGPKTSGANMSTNDRELVASMRKAMFVIQMKLESRLLRRRPEFHMEDRDLLNHIDYSEMMVDIDGVKHPLRDTYFPTIDRRDPSKLTDAEADVVKQLRTSFTNSEKLQAHVRFLYGSGSLYKCMNGNLLFHGCMPTADDLSFMTFDFDGGISGKELFDYCDKMARRAYYAKEGSEERQYGMDFLWWLWCGRNSPTFGRDRMTTFERMLVADESTWTEKKNRYYSAYESEEFCERILAEFGLTKDTCHIINGHIPVKVKEGESPLKAGGRLIVIDGGFCRAYQKYTGIAGYTMFFSSHGIRIAAHQPWGGVPESVRKGADILSETVISKNLPKRLMVGETDTGEMLKDRIDELEALLEAYRIGTLSEVGR